MIPIEFEGFSGDCRISGRLILFGDRLTDMLNDQDQYRITHVSLESLVDGHVVEVDSLIVDRVDLLAVVAHGPRGSDRRRVALDTVRMQVGLGPYVVAGRLHAEAGADPVANVLRRRPMVPLTHATIAYTLAGTVRVVDAETLIVNRELADWIAPTAGEADHFPDVEVRGPTDRNYVKDMTGISAF
jgi:hypothetical protein